jgi:DNA-directed RNA polymerase subunit K/omega
MSYKNTKLNQSIETFDVKQLASFTGNMYESIAIVSKRAKQISVALKEEINEKLNEYHSSIDSSEETFENREQITISKYYERLPKPTLLALNEFMEGETYFKMKE